MTRADGRTMIVAMDHGMFGGSMAGLENPERILREVIKGGADAIMTTTGIIKRYRSILARNVGIIWSIPNEVGYVEAAAKMGVDAVKLTYFVSVKEIQKIRELSKIADECDTWGVPLLVEMVPINAETPGQIAPTSNLDEVKQVSRCVAEQGGDMVKTIYTGDVASFRSVVEQCFVPIVILGGPKMKTDADVLKVVHESVEAGGAGVAFGRNVLLHQNPSGMVKAVSSILHRKFTVEEALQYLS